MIIEARFNGPPESANGGYTAGRLAAALGSGPAQVTLRTPPPLATRLRLVRTAAGIEAYAGPALVAEAVPDRLDEEPVPPVGYDEAAAASAGYPGFRDHPFPTCYVCGPRRAEGDGLRIFPGPLGEGRSAATWRVPPDVSEVVVWAALDCPGGWAIIGPGRPYVLGRITADVAAAPPPGAECVVVGAVVGVEGRKARVRTALYGPDGALLAVARAVWIAV